MYHRPVDFIIIGAMRCGTSSLYYELARHPEISMSRKKETNFFLGNCPKNTYQAQFNSAKVLWGEASPNYSKCDLYPDVPKNIHEHSPNAKLIYLVRDPSDRVVSQYRHERASLEEPISMQSAQMRHMIETSKYNNQLAKFREYFSKDAILVVAMKDLAKARRATLNRIIQHIGAAPFDWGRETPRDNTSLAVMKYPRMINKIRNNSLWQKLYSALPLQWQTRANGLVSHQSYCIYEGDEITICRNELLDELHEDIAAFGKAYDIDVSKWLKGTT